MKKKKKIEEFAIKKQQQNDLRRKVEEQKLKQKQDNHQKMIDIQYDNLLKIKREKEDALNKAILNSTKAKDDLEAKIEADKLAKRKKNLAEIKEQMEQDIKNKEDAKNKERQEDLQYIDEFKKKMRIQQ